MTLLNDILSAQNGAVVRQLANQFGLNENQAQSAVQHLLPMLARGIQHNTARPEGLQSLVQALQTGNHSRYVNQPGTLEEPATIQDGNAILGHIFGSKEVSRRVAKKASENTEVGTDILKKMLPVLAAAAMGMMSQHGQQTQQQGNPLLSALLGGSDNVQPARNTSTDMMSMLSRFLDADRDGSAIDDVLGMLVK